MKGKPLIWNTAYCHDIGERIYITDFYLYPNHNMLKQNRNFMFSPESEIKTPKGIFLLIMLLMVIVDLSLQSKNFKKHVL